MSFLYNFFQNKIFYLKKMKIMIIVKLKLLIYFCYTKQEIFFTGLGNCELSNNIIISMIETDIIIYSLNMYILYIEL